MIQHEQKTHEEHEEHAHLKERERKKLTVLVVLCSVVIILFWIATLPFSYSENEKQAAGPKDFFSKVGNQFEGSGESVERANTITDAIKN